MTFSLKIFTDGGARGNPGPAAVGVVIFDEHGKGIHRFGRAIGETTNNVAEYQAVIDALGWVEGQLKKPEIINFFLDSMLVAKQLSGNWKIKQAHLRELAVRVGTLIGKLGVKVTYTPIPRERNSEADFLVNQALDKC